MKNLEDLAKFPSENPNPVLRVNKEFVLYANQKGQELFNIKIGDRIPILLRDAIHKTFEENVTQNLEVALNHHFHSLFITPIKGANYVNIYGMDITERKRAEENLKESEAKWRAITEFSPDHILMMDKDAKILFINYTVPDLTVDEVLGRDYYDFVQEDFKEQQRKYYKEVMETGTPRLFETGYVDKEGNQFYFDVHSAPIWKEGKVIGIINRSNDITARKKKEEEIRLQSEIMINMSEGVYLIRLEDLIIVYTNPRFEEMFGYDPGEMIGKYFVMVNAPTDKTPEEIKNEIVGILKDTGEWHGEVLNIKKDGTRFWCYANVSLFDHPEYGKVIVAVHTDITERKNAEVEIVNLAKFPSENPNPVLRVTKEKVIYTNKAGEDVFKVISGVKLPELFRTLVSEVIDEGISRSKEIEFNQKIYSLNLTPIKEAGYVNIYGINITDRKRIELKLKQSEENYRLIFENANDGISILDLEGNFHEVNNLYCTRLGYTREELLKSNIRDINVPEFADLVSDRIVDIKEKRFNVFESAHKTKHGRIIPVEISAKSIIYENKPAILSIVRDITERKSAEIKLQKSEATYREAYKRAEFYKDIFTHDINNILQNISNGIQLNEMYLNKPEKSKAVKRNIDIIKRQVKRGANLVSNVRKLSKISESEAFLFNVNCIEVLKKSINYIKNTFYDKNLKIDIQISEENFKILANELLEDVFDNILTNSINYNDSEFINIEIKVTKELRQGINYTKFQFSDNGIGITDERKDQIFVRGYSEETSIHGMGLGLSLVKKIIKSYNGEIWMEDRVKGDYTKGNNCIIVIPEVVNNG